MVVAAHFAFPIAQYDGLSRRCESSDVASEAGRTPDPVGRQDERRPLAECVTSEGDAFVRLTRHRVFVYRGGGASVAQVWSTRVAGSVIIPRSGARGALPRIVGGRSSTTRAHDDIFASTISAAHQLRQPASRG